MANTILTLTVELTKREIRFKAGCKVFLDHTENVKQLFSIIDVFRTKTELFEHAIKNANVSTKPLK